MLLLLTQYYTRFNAGFGQTSTHFTDSRRRRWPSPWRATPGLMGSASKVRAMLQRPKGEHVHAAIGRGNRPY